MFSSYNSPNSDSSLISEYIRENLRKESFYGIKKFKKNSKLVEWSSYMPITWSKSSKSKQATFLQFLESNAQPVKP